MWKHASPFPPLHFLFKTFNLKLARLLIRLSFVLNSNLLGSAWFIRVPLGFLRNSCLPEWMSHLWSGLLCGFSRQLWLGAPGTAGRSFNTWTGDGMHRGQAAVSLQEERGQVGPPNPLQIFPLPRQRLPVRLNNTGAVLFLFPWWTTVPLEQQDLDLGITFQESGAALQKPRWCLSSVCRGLEGSRERWWSCGFGVEGDV